MTMLQFIPSHPQFLCNYGVYRSYFELSDGGIYRVSEDGKTWQYNPELKIEKLIWDVWGSPVDNALRNRKAENRYVQHDGVIEEEEVSILRSGPYEQDEWHGIDWNLFEWQGKLLEWEVTELYVFEIGFGEGGAIAVMAPNVGVLFYEFSVMSVPGPTRRQGSSVEFVGELWLG